MGKPAAVYDKIAQSYRDSKGLDFRKHIEEYTLFQCLGSPEGLSVLDLACGEGIYSRKLMKAGASRVVGVDISANMIELAEQSEHKEPLGIRYVVGDALELNLAEDKSFDVVLGMYLLNYAKDHDELQRFCRVAFDHLRPGGVFLGFNDNPMNSPEYFAEYRRYGFVKHGKHEKEGDAVTYELFNDKDGTSFCFNNYYIPAQQYTKAFSAAGFLDFEWRGPFLSKEQDDGSQEHKDFWAPFMDHPPLIGFSARKPIQCSSGN